jgi:hypothetical protein
MVLLKSSSFWGVRVSVFIIALESNAEHPPQINKVATAIMHNNGVFFLFFLMVIFPFFL